MLKTFAVFAVLVVTSVGCGRHLYHYHRTVVGLDVSGNVAGDTPSGHLTLGYSRRLVVIMPPEIENILQAEAIAKAAGEQASSSYIPESVFCTQVKASLGGVNSFREVLATGQPANGYAQRLAALSASSSDDAYRNFVCPGFEIPKPSKDAGPQATDSKPKP